MMSEPALIPPPSFPLIPQVEGLPSARLPDDLLSYVFFILYEGSSAHSQWVNITAVCHRWRNVALNLPHLWTAITMGFHSSPPNLLDLSELLARSKAMDISVDFDTTLEWLNYDLYARSLFPHKARIVFLHLRLDFGSIARVELLLLTGFPRLKGLSLDATANRFGSSGPPCSVGIPAYPILPDGYILETDRVIAAFKDPRPAAICSATEVYLNGHKDLDHPGLHFWSPNMHSASDMAYFLAHCHKLTHLTLTHTLPTDAVKNGFVDILNLPSLKSLSITDKPFAVQTLLEHLSAPALQFVCFSIDLSWPYDKPPTHPFLIETLLRAARYDTLLPLLARTQSLRVLTPPVRDPSIVGHGDTGTEWSIELQHADLAQVRTILSNALLGGLALPLDDVLLEIPPDVTAELTQASTVVRYKPPKPTGLQQFLRTLHVHSTHPAQPLAGLDWAKFLSTLSPALELISIGDGHTSGAFIMSLWRFADGVARCKRAYPSITSPLLNLALRPKTLRLCVPPRTLFLNAHPLASAHAPLPAAVAPPPSLAPLEPLAALRALPTLVTDPQPAAAPPRPPFLRTLDGLAASDLLRTRTLELRVPPRTPLPPGARIAVCDPVTGAELHVRWGRAGGAAVRIVRVHCEACAKMDAEGMEGLDEERESSDNDDDDSSEHNDEESESESDDEESSEGEGEDDDYDDDDDGEDGWFVPTISVPYIW